MKSEIKHMLLGAGIGFIAGRFLTSLSGAKAPELRNIHHKDIGTLVMGLGFLHPGVSGFGFGIWAEDFFTHSIRDILSEKTWIRHYHIDPFLPRSVQYRKIIEILKNAINHSTINPVVRKQAIQIIRDKKIHYWQKKRIITAVHDWIIKNIRYIPDPAIPGTDYFSTAQRTLKFRGGDCDDHAILSASFLKNLGFKHVYLILVAQRDPNIYNHVLTGVKLHPGGKIIPIETTPIGNKHFPVGYLVPHKKILVVRV